MAFVHGKDTVVLGAEYDFSSWLNATDVEIATDQAETTPYGSEAKTYIAGLSDGTLSFAGMYDDDGSGTPDQEAALAAMFQSASGEPWLVGIGGVDVGVDVLIAKARLASHAVSSPVGDVVALSVSVQADGGVYNGVSLHATAAPETSAGSETSVDQGAQYLGGAVGSVHLLAFTGTSIDVTIQHSVNDSVWVDLINFSTLTAPGSQFAEVSGTVERHVRAEWSGTFSSATFAVGYSKR